MPEDTELLRRYAEEKSDDAFGELVRRHVDFVYAAALRQARGNAPLAQDVTQAVFTDLARKAATLSGHEVVVGWLHTATRFAAIKAIRSESRRHAREQEAHAMNEMLHESGTPVDWERLHPVLDEVLGELKDRERAAILLRYFEKKPLAEVGAKLSLTETAARSCVDRSLDKMRTLLERRGVTSTTAALAMALANQVGVAAPAGLAASVTGAALAGTAAGAAGWVATFMSITKLQIGIAGALAVAGTTGYLLQAETNAGLRREIAAAQEQQQSVAALRVENQKLTATAAEVEMLRRDDFELKQLEQRVVEIKKANEEKARVATAHVQQDRWKEFADRIRADDQKAQEEVNRMNQEGNKLVGEFKELSNQAGLVTGEARVQADALVKAKLEEIKNKQSEVKAFVENTRKSLAQRIETFRSINGDDPNSPLPALQTGSGRFEVRRVPADSTAPASPPAIRAGAQRFEGQRVPVTSENPNGNLPPSGELKLGPKP